MTGLRKLNTCIVSGVNNRDFPLTICELVNEISNVHRMVRTTGPISHNKVKQKHVRIKAITPHVIMKCALSQ